MPTATWSRSPTPGASTRPTWQCARHRASAVPTSSSDDLLSHFLVTVAVDTADGTATDAIAFDLWQRGAVGVEELRGGVRAAFTDPVSAERTRAAMAPGATIERVDDTHGLDVARDLLTVEFAGRFAVHPPWLEPPAGHQPIEIDPGHAFGSGSHPSTRLALELLGEETPPPGKTFDVGCGTGVLAIAAALLGAHVVAVDIDPAAITATAANAGRNRVADRVDVATGSAGLVVDAVDLVTVNVTIDIHERIAPALHPAHRRLIVAGVLGEEQLRRCATAYGAVVTRSTAHGGWMAAVLTRP